MKAYVQPHTLEKVASDLLSEKNLTGIPVNTTFQAVSPGTEAWTCMR